MGAYGPPARPMLAGFPCRRARPIRRWYQGLDHGAGHLAPLRSILRLAVVDSEALAVEQRMPKSPQTATAVSDRKTAPLRSFHLRA